MVEKTLESEGFKMANAGPIPKDWNEIYLSEALLGNPKYGINAAAVEYTESLPTYLRITDISNDGHFLSSDKVSVDNENSGNYYLKENDLVFARTGASTGKTYLYNRDDGRLVYAGFLIKVSVDDKIMDSRFLKAYTQTGAYWNWVRIMSTRSGQPGINGNEYSKLPVPLPTLSEQKAIAEVLTDTDNLIQSLEKLIDKKAKVKQGAMQQLLTGKKRLPRFNGKWEVKRLGEVSDIRTGKRNNQDKVSNGLYPFFVRSQNVERINTFSYNGEAILVPGEGGIGNIFHYINGKFEVHQRVYKISDFSNISGKYLYYYMKQSFGAHAMKNTVKATVDSLRLPTFQEFEMDVPSSLEEQKAIAQILSDMDAEIEALEEKLEKYKKIKQGMMQELLTGRIRLK